MHEKKLVHVEKIPVRWGDMDAMGHVNNTVYFRYMEQARISWFEALLPRGEAWATTSIVIVNASCNFKKPINYPGTVEVKVFVGEPGGSSLRPTTNCVWRITCTPTAPRRWCSWTRQSRSRCASPTTCASCCNEPA